MTLSDFILYPLAGRRVTETALANAQRNYATAIENLLALSNHAPLALPAPKAKRAPRKTCKSR